MNHARLKDCYLCAECSTVSTSATQCPSCACYHGMMSLASVLDRTSQIGANHVEWNPGWVPTVNGLRRPA